MADKTGTILIIDDDEDILVAGKLLLKRHYKRIVTCNRPEHIPDLFNQHNFDAILLDMNFGPGESSGEQGFYWLDRIMEINPEAVVVMITAHGGVDKAVEAMKRGATDFITKPWQNEKVIATLSASVKLSQTLNEATKLKKAHQALNQSASAHNQPIIGDSGEMNDLMSLVSRAAPTDANVLILGENGTGKELVARAIHAASNRSDKVFISVDLGAVTESLFESELFGHKKGAFTDAREDRVGLFEAANGGTIFLDEVGNLALHLQAKLLTVLEQRQVTPVGANHPVPINVRVIAATNATEDKLKNEDHFRQDLLFRLNTVELAVPPLRARATDIPNIAKYYADLFARKYQKPTRDFSDKAIIALMQHSWPGNVRELRHAVERAVILAAHDQFEPEDFAVSTPKPEKENTTKQNATAPEPQALPDNQSLNLEELEKSAIDQALKRHSYNISHAAKELGLTRAALYRRMEKHGL